MGMKLEEGQFETRRLVLLLLKDHDTWHETQWWRQPKHAMTGTLAVDPCGVEDTALRAQKPTLLIRRKGTNEFISLT